MLSYNAVKYIFQLLCLGYFFLAVMKHHDQGTVQKEGFISHAGEAGQQATDMVAKAEKQEAKSTGDGMRL